MEVENIFKKSVLLFISFLHNSFIMSSFFQIMEVSHIIIGVLLALGVAMTIFEESMERK